MNKKLLYSILTVLLIAIVSVGITYAWLSWSSSVNIGGTSECFDVNYVKGQDIGSDSNQANFSLASSYKGGLSSVLKVNLKDTCTITNGTGTLYLNTDSTTSSILLTSGVLKYQVLDGTNEVANGTVTKTGSLAIYKDIAITSTVKELTVYVWLDGSLVNDSNSNDILSSIYKGNITMNIESGDK